MTTTATAAETRYALYRFFDDQMQLLYVGITNEPWGRWREHVADKPWYPKVKHWAVTFHGAEAEARQAELRAIRGEAPPPSAKPGSRPPTGRPKRPRHPAWPLLLPQPVCVTPRNR